MKHSAGRLIVLGPGTLGRNLALWAAQRAYSVVLLGRNSEHAQSALSVIAQTASRVSLPQDLSFLELISCSNLDSFKFEPGDIFIECLPEVLTIKQQNWANLFPSFLEDTVLLTGTSSISLANLCQNITDECRIVAFHLFVPIHARPLVELAFRPETDLSIRQNVLHFAQKLGLDPITVLDSPGFVASRLGLALGLEAFRVLEEGLASPETIDALAMKAYGHPIGPLELSDRVGLDVRLAIATHLFHQTGIQQFRPPTLLRQLVSQGHYGKKTGKGVYNWNIKNDNNL